MGRYVKNRELRSGSYSIRLPMGSGAVGPNSPVNGLTRYNTIRDRPENFFKNRWRSMIGNEIDVPAKDTFYGDGMTTEFSPMSYPYPAGNEIFLLVFIQNVFQNPGIAYTIDNFRITFTSPPPAGHPVVILHGVMNGSAFEPIPPVPFITTTTTTTTTTTGPGTTTTSTTTTTTTAAPGAVVNAVVNGDFEDNRILADTAQFVLIPGWKIYKQSFRIGGTTQFLGCNTPSSTIPGYTGVESPYLIAAYSASYSDDFVPGLGGTKSLMLMLAGSTESTGQVGRGPILVSENYLNLEQNDVIEMYWKVEMKPLSFYIEENYDVIAYLVSNTCNTLVLFHATGQIKEWTKVSRKISIAETGEYRLVVVAGSYDRTNGKAVGTQLYLDNIKLIKASTATGP